MAGGRGGGNSYSTERMVIRSVGNGSPVLTQDNDIHTATSLSSQIPIETRGKEGRKKGTKGTIIVWNENGKGATVSGEPRYGKLCSS